LAGEILPIRGALGNICARAGRRREAEGLLQELVELDKARYVSPLDFALVYAGLGKTDELFRCFEKAAAERCGRLGWALVDPRYESFHSNPRFVALLEQVHPERSKQKVASVLPFKTP